MKIVTVVGARPQFIKAVAVSRAVAARGASRVLELLVHTGQHHDERMSDVFFDELGIAPPAHRLHVAGGNHGEMTGKMLEPLERILRTERPDWVLIYGDTNSTLAGALVAAKLRFPIAHVEAGLRSFNRKMPEEINRIVADRLSSVLLCPTETAVENLASEGISTGVHLVGDVMYDVALHFGEVAATRTQILERLGLEPKQYVLATCHRAENTNDPVRLSAILRGLARVAAHKQVIFPAHPRTVRRIAELNLLGDLGSVQITEPASYLEMIALERNADVIVTDSGGVQKEAFFYRVPCVTVRDETEWVETMRAGWNTLVGADPDKIAEAVAGKTPRERLEISPYGTGNAGERILDVLLGPG